jgi:hypothetical protein
MCTRFCRPTHNQCDPEQRDFLQTVFRRRNRRPYEHVYKIAITAAKVPIVRNDQSWLKAKTVPLRATEALGERGGLAPTHSRPRD